MTYGKPPKTTSAIGLLSYGSSGHGDLREVGVFLTAEPMQNLI